MDELEGVFEITGQEDKPKVTVWDNYCPIVKKKNIVEVYLTDVIDTPDNYNELVHTLNNASKKHTIKIFINNGGGAVDSAFMLVDAIKSTKAKTVAYLSGTVASASTIIALSCSDIVISKYLAFMIHNYSHSSGHNSGNAVKNYVDFTDKELKRAFREIYSGFLSNKEIDDVVTMDKELWFNEIDVAKRWSKIKSK